MTGDEAIASCVSKIADAIVKDWQPNSMRDDRPFHVRINDKHNKKTTSFKQVLSKA